MKTVFVFALTITAFASCRHREQEGAIDPAIVETGKVALTMGRIPDNGSISIPGTSIKWRAGRASG